MKGSRYLFNNIKTGIVAAALLGIILAFVATFAILPLSTQVDQMNHFELLLSIGSIVGFGIFATALQSRLIPKVTNILAILTLSVTFLIVSLLLRLIN